MFRVVACSVARATSSKFRRSSSTGRPLPLADGAQRFTVTLDAASRTLYVDQALAEALGWTDSANSSISLTLSGKAPHYFAIAPTGSDAGPFNNQTRAQRLMRRRRPGAPHCGEQRESAHAGGAGLLEGPIEAHKFW